MNKRIKTRLVLKRKVKVLFSKILCSIILFLVGMIIVKKDPLSNQLIRENLYEKSLPFQNVKMMYEKYFGNILSGDKKIKKTESVFSEKIYYEKKEDYLNGVKLFVSNHYLVPNLNDGIIIYIGEMEKIGKVVVVELEDGVDDYYGNIISTDKKLYDYVEKGEVIGQVEDNSLYLAFQKKGVYLDYKNYL